MSKPTVMKTTIQVDSYEKAITPALPLAPGFKRLASKTTTTVLRTDEDLTLFSTTVEAIDEESAPEEKP